MRQYLRVTVSTTGNFNCTWNCLFHLLLENILEMSSIDQWVIKLEYKLTLQGRNINIKETSSSIVWNICKKILHPQALAKLCWEQCGHSYGLAWRVYSSFASFLFQYLGLIFFCKEIKEFSKTAASTSHWFLCLPDSSYFQVEKC